MPSTKVRYSALPVASYKEMAAISALSSCLPASTSASPARMSRSSHWVWKVVKFAVVVLARFQAASARVSRSAA